MPQITIRNMIPILTQGKHKHIEAWIQNVAELRRNGRAGKVLELGESRFHAAIAAIWNVIAVLE